MLLLQHGLALLLQLFGCQCDRAHISEQLLHRLLNSHQIALERFARITRKTVGSRVSLLTNSLTASSGPAHGYWRRKGTNNLRALTPGATKAHPLALLRI